MLQATSSSVQPIVGVPQPRAIVRGSPTRNDSQASRRLNSHGTVALRNIGKELSVIQQASAGNAQAQQHLFGGNTDRLYRSAFSVLRNREDA
jgi:hypothetical protein